ncbi:hypothetical protein Pint_08014 [Pistacia integerrima]|uniref:Uncharacterized protein n=1 Tax=Pistacia integerrima TaxID=434235 RepID=A0ACC0XY81_9ROSI|nr:hypothetical protein Pint_08014 [Pistacia integerrima]
MAKLEFPRYSGDDPTEWFNRVDQFFEFQGTIETKKVSLASFHLEGEASSGGSGYNNLIRRKAER